MISDHQILRLHEITPGSMVAEAVVSATGQVLLPRGAAVTAAIIEQLRAAGIATLPILHMPPKGSSREQAVAERLRHIFRNAGGHPPSLDLQRQLSAYRLTKNDD